MLLVQNVYVVTLQIYVGCFVLSSLQHFAVVGDAAVGFNFAATLCTQTLFLCRNNGYAISTPVAEQYRGDGIAARGAAYGIDAIRIDGTDLVAVYMGVEAARERVMRKKKPVLVELLTYRLGHHSTSDDSSAYRDTQEVAFWNSPQMHPLRRFGNFLEKQGRWSPASEDYVAKEAEQHCKELIRAAERMKKPPILSSMFDDVYDSYPSVLKEQRNSLDRFFSQSRRAHAYELQKYADEVVTKQAEADN